MMPQATRLGERFGSFILEEQLGGPRSRVYRAIHLGHRRSVALKLLPTDEPLQPAEVQALSTELEFLRTLVHPHVVRCYGGGAVQGEAYLAHELVYGRSLQEALRHGPLPWPVAVDSARQAAAGLEYAHQRGVVHGNLSPSKILIDEDGRVRVAGFRQPTTPAVHPALQVDEETAPYRSPEQMAGKPAVVRSDLYALGCIVFEMLAGQPPYASGSVEQIRYHKQYLAPPRVSRLAADCPVWLDRLVAQLLEPETAERPQFASEVVVALDEARERTASGASTLQHALGKSASALRRTADTDALRTLLPARKKRPKSDAAFYERTSFLASCLLAALVLVVWLLRPPSDETLMQRARARMETDSRTAWEEARSRYLEPLLARYPDSPYAAEAQAYIDRIDIERARARLRLNRELGRSPTTAAERDYVRCVEYAETGDWSTAASLLEALAERYAAHPREEPFVKLARHTAEEIRTEHPQPVPTGQFLRSRLDEAARLQSQGHVLEARRLLLRLIDLYQQQAEVAPLVEEARTLLVADPLDHAP